MLPRNGDFVPDFIYRNNNIFTDNQRSGSMETSTISSPSRRIRNNFLGLLGTRRTRLSGLSWGNDTSKS
ncbi:ORF 3 [Feline immunodeficiency virus]|uniref:Env protein n=1 Tax=Feline immunodeficiency virus (isolate Petaluma) TaxID=11674 RepID=Q66014_FIVPE|nr:ORF 3 [Feline immunodeficiency virus]AAB59941.1 ORF 3 [Feline immunodeficiency virus]